MLQILDAVQGILADSDLFELGESEVEEVSQGSSIVSMTNFDALSLSSTNVLTHTLNLNGRGRPASSKRRQDACSS